MSIKATPTEKATEQEIRLFVQFLKQDKSIKEVNYDQNKVSYRSGSYMVDVTFKVKL
jgi:hypothetical protein